MNDTPSPPEKPLQQPEFLIDPEIIVFSSEDAPPPGTVELHSLSGKLANMFSRSKADVSKELDARLQQVRSMLEQADSAAGAFELSEVTVELGFSAEGAIVFVAKAGIQTTIAVKFTRRPKNK
jgi:hypothetical protein